MTLKFNNYLDTKQPYRALCGAPRRDADYIEQNGFVYGWSESNCCYEFAWFLYSEPPFRNPMHLANILKDRPFTTRSGKVITIDDLPIMPSDYLEDDPRPDPYSLDKVES